MNSLTHNPPKLKHEDSNNLIRSIIGTKIETVINNLPKEDHADHGGLIAKF
jgi:hypothetical protein